MKQKNRQQSRIFFCFALIIYSSFLSITALPEYSGELNSLERFLPEKATINPWKVDSQATVFEGTNLYDYINGGAEIFYEYGFTQVITQRYVFGDESITIDIYEMNHPKGAFGIYSIQRDPHMSALNVGDEGTEFDYSICFYQDHFYVAITATQPDDNTKLFLLQMAQDVSKKINKTSRLPDLLQKLPRRNLLFRSEGYIEGILGLNTQFYLGDRNILGIDGEKIECVFGRYHKQENQAHMLLIRYPDSTAAYGAQNLVKEFFTNRYDTTNQKDFLVFQDNRNRFYHFLRTNNLLYIISRSSSIDLIEEIESSINKFEN
jgi:hypothetical protein